MFFRTATALVVGMLVVGASAACSSSSSSTSESSSPQAGAQTSSGAPTPTSACQPDSSSKAYLLVDGSCVAEVTGNSVRMLKPTTTGTFVSATNVSTDPAVTARTCGVLDAPIAVGATKTFDIPVKDPNRVRIAAANTSLDGATCLFQIEFTANN